MNSKTLPPGPITPFQELIYALVLQIPRGRVCTYAALSRAATAAASNSNSKSTSLSSSSSSASVSKPSSSSSSAATRTGSKATASAKTSKAATHRQQQQQQKQSKKCSPRAVGGALRRNPFAPEVPCHRVLASNGFIGGFKGSWDACPSGINQSEKRRLLREEGVLFEDGSGVLSEACKGCWWDGFDVRKV